MNVTSSTIAKLKELEGLRLKAYTDKAGVRTIGYGHTGGSFPDQINLEEAEAYLMNDIRKAEAKVMKYDSIYHWNENEYNALVLFAFNIGSLDKLTNYGKRDRSTIGAKMLEYVHAGGMILQGLVNRRRYERELFFKPVYNDTESYITDVVRFAHVKLSYRLRSRPEITEDTKLSTVSQDTPCTIIGVSGDFYYVDVNGKKCFVFKEGVIYK